MQNIKQKCFQQHNNLAILAILLLGLLLRLVLIDSSFWLDEAAQYLEIIRPLNQQFDIVKDFQPPLLHLILHTSYSLLKTNSELSLRLVGSLIPGLITIWATYEIGKKLINKNAGLLAALLLATNSFHIFYSQELRPYSLPTAIATLSWLVLISVSHPELVSGSQNFRSRTKSGMTKFIFLFFFLSACGLYSSYLYPFLILSQIVYVVLFNRKIFSQIFYSLVFSLLAFLPWLPMFLKQLSIGTSWQSELPGWSEVVSLTQIKALPLTVGKFLYGVVDLDFNLKFILITFFILFLIVAPNLPKLVLSVKKKNFSLLSSFFILLIWFFIPLLTVWLVSFVVPVLRPKRVLYLLPAFYLLISSLLNPKQKILRSRNKFGMTSIFMISTLILLTVNLVSTYNYYTNPKYQREDWRSLHQEIYDRFDQESTLVVFSFDEEFAPWRVYEKWQMANDKWQSMDTFVTGQLNISNVNDLDEKLELVKNYRTILVFDYLRDLTDPDDKLLDSIKNKGFVEVGALDKPNIGLVRILINLN